MAKQMRIPTDLSQVYILIKLAEQEVHWPFIQVQYLVELAGHLGRLEASS